MTGIAHPPRGDMTKMHCRTFGSRIEAEVELAREIAELVQARPGSALGLATGNTPTGVYAELARLHRDEGLDMSRVSTFNLDEYEGLPATHPQSFRSWMKQHLFDPAGIVHRNTHFPVEESGSESADRCRSACERFEASIARQGGIDLLLLGIGRNGHIAFNEPGSARHSRTRRVELHPWTREDAARNFHGLDAVPTHALTMGIGTILDARRLRVLAFGSSKREVVARTLATVADDAWPVSHLAGHSDVRFYVDSEALPR